jgi:hypothetical protein
MRQGCGCAGETEPNFTQNSRTTWRKTSGTPPSTDAWCHRPGGGPPLGLFSWRQGARRLATAFSGGAKSRILGHAYTPFENVTDFWPPSPLRLTKIKFWEFRAAPLALRAADYEMCRDSLLRARQALSEISGNPKDTPTQNFGLGVKTF